MSKKIFISVCILLGWCFAAQAQISQLPVLPFMDREVSTVQQQSFLSPFGSATALPSADMSSVSADQEWQSSSFTVDGSGSFSEILHQIQPINNAYAARGSLDGMQIMDQVVKTQEAQSAVLNGPNYAKRPTDPEIGVLPPEVPVGDAVLPLLLMSLMYVAVRMFRNRKSENQ